MRRSPPIVQKVAHRTKPFFCVYSSNPIEQTDRQQEERRKAGGAEGAPSHLRRVPTRHISMFLSRESKCRGRARVQIEISTQTRNESCHLNKRQGGARCRFGDGSKRKRKRKRRRSRRRKRKARTTTHLCKHSFERIRSVLHRHFPALTRISLWQAERSGRMTCSRRRSRSSRVGVGVGVEVGAGRCANGISDGSPLSLCKLSGFASPLVDGCTLLRSSTSSTSRQRDEFRKRATVQIQSYVGRCCAPRAKGASKSQDDVSGALFLRSARQARQ